MLQLIALVNEQLWVGHFDLWSAENVVMFRHALLLAGGAEPTHGQCEMLLKVAVDACERYFQAFQFVLWAGKSAREALDSVLFETEGEALNEARRRHRPSSSRRMSRRPFRLVLVGAGKMGGAMLEGWLAVGLDPSAVTVIEPAPAPEIAALVRRARHRASTRQAPARPEVAACWRSSRRC